LVVDSISVAIRSSKSFSLFNCRTSSGIVDSLKRRHMPFVWYFTTRHFSNLALGFKYHGTSGLQRSISVTKIFVSSTIYDLIDVRAEVAEHLRKMGLTPIMSDDMDSPFKIDTNASSIATCLSNVRGCSAFVCILSQRYGPRLGAYGFDNVSATHLEYNEAKALGIPIYFYIRDKLDGEFSIWKKNRAASFVWISKPEDQHLFEFIDARKALVAGGDNNWCDTFGDSIGLKKRIQKDLGGLSQESRIQALIDSDRIPFLRPELRFNNETGNKITFVLTLRNIGDRPALNVRPSPCYGLPAIVGDLASAESCNNKGTLTAVRNSTIPFTLAYLTVEGFQLKESFEAEAVSDGFFKLVRREAKINDVWEAL